jgi:hypothetical protein
VAWWLAALILLLPGLTASALISKASCLAGLQALDALVGGLRTGDLKASFAATPLRISSGFQLYVVLNW